MALSLAVATGVAIAVSAHSTSAAAQGDAGEQTANLKNYALALCMNKVYEKLGGPTKISQLIEQEAWNYLEKGTRGPGALGKEIYEKVFEKTAEHAANVAPESALSECLDWQANLLRQG